MQSIKLGKRGTKVKVQKTLRVDQDILNEFLEEIRIDRDGFTKAMEMAMARESQRRRRARSKKSV